MSFSAVEREMLLKLPGIGPGVLARLEAVGYDSIERLRRDGVDRAVHSVVASGGTVAWFNRLAALERAVTSCPSCRVRQLRSF